jgi:hypothetical protein
VTLLLIVSVVSQGEELLRALVWSIVPIAILWYLISPSGGQTLNADSAAK